MSFWEEHAKTEADRKVKARLPQDAPAFCFECGHMGADVLFGTCAACFKDWQDTHA